MLPYQMSTKRANVRCSRLAPPWCFARAAGASQRLVACPARARQRLRLELAVGIQQEDVAAARLGEGAVRTGGESVVLRRAQDDVDVAVQVPVQVTVDVRERRVRRGIVVNHDFIREAVAGSRD